MDLVQKLVTEDSFDARGTLVREGQIGTFDKARLTGKEPHLHNPSGDPQPVVQIAALAPSGPNPTMPQQIPPDAYQTPGGGYAQPDAILTAERTLPAEERHAGLTEPGSDAQGEHAEALRKALEENAALKAQIRAAAIQGNAARIDRSAISTENNNDALVEGNVKDIVASLGGKTDDELDALRAAEMDNERPCKGVLDGIKAEQAKRTAQS